MVLYKKWILISSAVTLLLTIILFYYFNKNSNSSEVNKQIKIISIIKKKEIYYTQGLILSNNNKFLIESGGLYGKSTLVNMTFPELGIINKVKLSDKYFGEGVSLCNDKVFQLTWKERKILKYKNDLSVLEELDLHPNIKEGWGFAQKDKNTLLVTDGSNKIHELSCSESGDVEYTSSQIEVKLNGKNIDYLNDLVYVNGFIYANVYYSNFIVKIQPSNGNIVELHNCTDLLEYEFSSNSINKDTYLVKGEVFNGITHYQGNQFLVTGKHWGHYYIIEL